MRIAFFDLDHTLLKGNSANLFIRYMLKRGELGWSDVARGLYYTLLHRFNRVDIEQITARYAEKYRDIPEVDVINQSDEWFDTYVRPVFYDDGIELIAEHRERGDHLVLLTASTIYACMPISRHLGLDHFIGTRLDVADGVLTGKLTLPLCYGAGKVEQAQAYVSRFPGASLDDAWFYSDSVTDLPMLEAVGNPVAVNPDPLLAREAKRRGWPIRRFRR